MIEPSGDLRGFLAHLEGTGRLRRVTCQVDKDTELACIARWAMEATARDEQYAIRFDSIRGHRLPVVIQCYATRAMYAEALGTTPEAILARWNEAMAAPIAPVAVARAPAHEVVDTRPDLGAWPIPVWTPGRDAGPYIPSAAVITKDPKTGVQNLATYRIQVHGARELGVFFGSRLQHGAIHAARWHERGEPAPVALAVGVPPAVNFAAAAKTAYGVDELTIAGGLMKRPVEVVPAKTVELLVPARAELVIEGVIRMGALRTEAPFGEALGYMNEAGPAPLLEVTAITHRRNPIVHGYVQQFPPSDGHLVMELGVLGPLAHSLASKLGLRGIADMAILPGSAGVSAVVVQWDGSRGSSAATIGAALAQLNFGQRWVILVDADIDIRDEATVNWALSCRVDPSRDIRLIDGTKAFQPDPAVIHRARTDGAELAAPPYFSSMAIIDATVKCPVPELSLPPKRLMEQVLARWGETGLPPIRPPSRLRRLLEKHPGPP